MLAGNYMKWFAALTLSRRGETPTVPLVYFKPEDTPTFDAMPHGA